MARRDTLIVNITKRQQEMSVDFSKSECFEGVYDNDMLLLYKYVTLLHLDDLRRAETYVEKNIDNPNYDRTSLEAARESIITEQGQYEHLYKSEGQFEGIALLPIDKKFEEIMLSHKKDLEGIYEVTEDSVKAYADLLNQAVFKTEQENEEVQINNADIKRLNEEALDEGIHTPKLDTENLLSKEAQCERLESVRNSKENKTKDEEELFDEIEELIENEEFEFSDQLIDSTEEALLSSSNGDLQIYEVEPTEEEIEAASDERLTEIIQESEEEFSNENVNEEDESEEMTDDEFDELGF